MKVISLQTGSRRLLDWNGNQEPTGIFKVPTDQPLVLKATGVEGDFVGDLKVHGGVDKAVYLYGTQAYPFWQEIYPGKDLGPGMFGENITLEGLDESRLRIGDILEGKECSIQIAQVRQPCFKLGLKFDDAGIVQKFKDSVYPGAYARVLIEGPIHPGETLRWFQTSPEAPTVLEVFRLLYAQEPNQTNLTRALESPFLAKSQKESLRKKYGIMG